ncbi:hypothetical protein Tco_0730178 [Tanacetum coccineum]|uniref:Integrase, catalytic region, zinc finger, CCHC-type, peptidase aspartic, catalytic n=1 Tax=Tanacetum coccineum TaxID=301880 RepID=A0ABQ4YRX3_9ASTR
MSSNSDDIQAAGSDTRPPMLDRTDYESWSQRIWLYCRGKENGIYILQSIDHGPFELGTTRDTLGTTPEGGVLLGPERPRTYDDLNDNDKKRFDADVRATNIVLQGLPKDIYKLINHNIEAKAIWDNVKMLLAGSELTKEDRESQLYDEFERFKMLPGENINEYYGRLNQQREMKETNHEQLYAYLKQHEKHAAQDRLIIEKITPTTNDPLAFVSNVQPYAQLSHVQSKQHPSSSTPLQSPHNSDFFKDKMLLMQAQENGAVLDEEKLLFLAGDQTNTFDAYADDQPVKDLAQNDDNIFQADECDAFDSDVDDEPTVYCAPSVPIDASVLHDNNAYIPHDPLVTELSIYKQQVAMYEQYAKFDLILCEQKMDEQMRMLIQDRNKKEENLKNELHYVKLQLNSTIKSNTIIKETITALKHEFKHKETKFITDFSNLKTLNDKLEYKLYAQDQFIQTVHMMLKPKKLHDHDDVTAVGAQNPFYLRKAEVAQPTLYDGDEILKTHHVPISVTSSEEDLEIAEITRQKMNDPVCVEKRIKIIPPNYSKENFLATFTPHTQLTLEQVFWSNDLLKQRAEALKANSSPLPILPPATVSLVKEVRAMKAVFENMEAEVDQNAIDKKCREIERKNLLITNENLIANCIAQDVFYTVTDSALSASRFHDLSTAYNVAMTRVVELEYENSKLLDKIQHDSHDTMVKDFSKLEVAHLNLQLKYQHLKENIENFKSKSSKDVHEFDTFFELGIRDDQIQGHRNTIRKLKAQISQLKANKSDELCTLDYKSLDSQNFQLNETVTTL